MFNGRPSSRTLLCLSLLSCLLAGPVFAQTKTKPAASQTKVQIFDRNLLKNGNAEAAYVESKKVPSWPTVEGFSVAPYGSVSGEWDWGLSGCPSCGKQYLRLQFMDKKELSVTQTMDVAAAAEKIDAGKATARISAYLGGLVDGDTSGVISASFQDAAGKELATMATDPFDAAKLTKCERGSTGLTPVEKSAAVAAQTRKIVFTWTGQATATPIPTSALAIASRLSLHLPGKELLLEAGAVREAPQLP
jgi:hypothetical protein